MIVSIGQPAYLPWLGYFQRLAWSDLHVVLDHVQFERHSNVNRNQILLNGQQHWLTVPVQTAGLGLDIPINKIEVAYNTNWARKHLMTITQAYRGTPALGDVVDMLTGPLTERQRLLVDIAADLTTRLTRYLQIDTPKVSSASMGLESSKSQLVLDICVRAGATVYLSGSKGRDYLNLADFADAGIEVRFHDFQATPYPQRTEQFTPNLSIVDAICNLGVGARMVVL